MNDPNGLIERDGVHHLFFQHNPHATTFGPMHWGHATSSDLLAWNEQPVALAPGDPGDCDDDGCWSGCAVPLPGGRVAMLYSANHEQRQLPALAWSVDADLVTWEKSEDNPVIGSWPPVLNLTDLRDHSVLREGDGWRQVLAAGRDSLVSGSRGASQPVGEGRGGLLLSYLSDGDDLTRWTYDGVLLDGAVAGLPGEVWECPDVFVVQGEAVVILSWYLRGSDPSAPVLADVIWLTGALAGGRFTPTRFGRLDLGDRFYAPQSYGVADGRRLMVGWLRTQLDPASAGHLSVGTASLPRRLQVLDGRLHQDPAREVDRLARVAVAVLTPSTPLVELSEPVPALELLVSTDVPHDLASVIVELSAPGGHQTSISLAAFAAATTWARSGSDWLPVGSRSRRARVLVDAGLVEVFTDDGRAAAHSDLSLTAVARVELTGVQGHCEVTVSILGPPDPGQVAAQAS